jgi:hypothetical protein
MSEVTRVLSAIEQCDQQLDEANFSAEDPDELLGVNELLPALFTL